MKVYANNAGTRVEVGEITQISETDARTVLEVKLYFLPVNGLLTLSIEKGKATAGVLRVQCHGVEPNEPKIRAIKAYREIFFTGLGEAKSRIENSTRVAKESSPGHGYWEYDLTPSEVERLNAQGKLLRAADIEYGVPIWEVVLS